MTIREANAVNQLLKYVLRYRTGARTDEEEVGEAGVLLARGAYKALFAGYTPGEWLTKWNGRERP